MGCDIHLTVEKKFNNKWVMVNRIERPAPASERDYNFFAALAGVRSYSDDDMEGVPKGLPPDLSESTALFYDEWYGDAHSASWAPMAEAIDLLMEHKPPPPDRKAIHCDLEWAMEHYFGIYTREKDTADDYRMVFWFDN